MPSLPGRARAASASPRRAFCSREGGGRSCTLECEAHIWAPGASCPVSKATSRAPGRSGMSAPQPREIAGSGRRPSGTDGAVTGPVRSPGRPPWSPAGPRLPSSRAAAVSIQITFRKRPETPSPRACSGAGCPNLPQRPGSSRSAREESLVFRAFLRGRSRRGAPLWQIWTRPRPDSSQEPHPSHRADPNRAPGGIRPAAREEEVQQTRGCRPRLAAAWDRRPATRDRGRGVW